MRQDIICAAQDAVWIVITQDHVELLSPEIKTLILGLSSCGVERQHDAAGI